MGRDPPDVAEGVGFDDGFTVSRWRLNWVRSGLRSRSRSIFLTLRWLQPGRCLRGRPVATCLLSSTTL